MGFNLSGYCKGRRIFRILCRKLIGFDGEKIKNVEEKSGSIPTCVRELQNVF